MKPRERHWHCTKIIQLLDWNRICQRKVCIYRFGPLLFSIWNFIPKLSQILPKKVGNFETFINHVVLDMLCFLKMYSKSNTLYKSYTIKDPFTDIVCSYPDNRYQKYSSLILTILHRSCNRTILICI